MAEKPTDSKKHRSVADEPIGDKPVEDIPGIGVQYGRMLRERGYIFARQVFFQFLSLNCDKEKFFEWLRGITGAQQNHLEQAYASLKEHLDQFSIDYNSI